MYPRTIRGRLTLLIVATQAVLAALLVVALPRYLEEQETITLLQRLQGAADVAAFDVAAAHAGEHGGRVRDILKATVDVPDLVYASYTDSAGRRVEEQWTTGSPVDLRLHTTWPGDLSPDGRWIQIRFPVRLQGDDLGRIRLVASTEQLQAVVARARMRTAQTMVLLLLVGGGMAWGIGSLATRRLRQISATAEAVAAGRLDQRAEVRGAGGDVDALASAFNRMVEGLVEARQEVVDAQLSTARVMDHMPVSVAVFDESLRCVALNKTALPDPALRERALGDSLETLVTLSGDAEAGRRFQAHLEEARERWRVVEREEVVRHRDLGKRHLLLRIVSLVVGQSERRFVVCGLDITNLRRAEATLASREVELRQAQKMEAVGRLAGGVAHDFNNLLTVIGGHADILLMDLADGSSEHLAADEIRQATTRATDLVRQLLIFSRREGDELGAVDVNGSLDDIARLIQRMVGEDIELIVRPSPGLPPVLLGPGRLQQVVMNLAVNARDAMPRGGRLLLTTGVSLRTGGPDGGEPVPQVHVTVSDTGHGMDDDLVQQIFEPFFTTKEVGRGTGLGLSTVYGIVQQGSGDIEVSTTPGAGTAFDVSFPATTREATPPARAPKREAEAVGWGGNRAPRILLAEDDDAVRGFLNRQLVSAGCRVTATGDPAEAARLVLDEGLLPDLVVADVVMPEMSGPELVALLRERHTGLPALFITGYERDHLEALPLADRDTLLRKPFSPARFLQTVHRCVGDTSTQVSATATAS